MKVKIWKGMKITLNYFGKLNGNFGIERERAITSNIDDNHIPFGFKKNIILYNKKLTNRRNKSNISSLSHTYVNTFAISNPTFDKIKINDFNLSKDKYFINYLQNYPYYKRINSVKRIFADNNIKHNNFPFIPQKNFNDIKYKSLKRFEKFNKNIDVKKKTNHSIIKEENDYKKKKKYLLKIHRSETNYTKINNKKDNLKSLGKNYVLEMNKREHNYPIKKNNFSFVNYNKFACYNLPNEISDIKKKISNNIYYYFKYNDKTERSLKNDKVLIHKRRKNDKKYNKKENTIIYSCDASTNTELF